MEVARALCRLIDVYGPPVRGMYRMRTLLERFIALPDGEIVVTMNNALKLLVNPGSEPIIDRSLYIYGTYEPNLMWLLARLLRPGDVFVDVGANIGHLSVIAASLVGAGGRVLAVEPTPSTFNILRHNLQLNDLGQAMAVNVALGIKGDRLSISIPGSTGRGGASLLPVIAAVRRDIVTVITFDSFSRTHGIDRCRMVKIDVEGFESQVIAGGSDFFSRRASEIICMEYSVEGSHCSWDPIVAVKQLLDYGYILYRSTVSKGSNAKSRLVRISNLEYLPKHDNIYFLSPESLSTIMIADIHGMR